MQLLVIALATIIVSCVADVSHLNNEYLPPDQPGEVEVENNQIAVDVPIVIGADTITPADLFENGIISDDHYIQQPSPVDEQQTVASDQPAAIQEAVQIPSLFSPRSSVDEAESNQIDVLQHAPQQLYLQPVAVPSSQQQNIDVDVQQQQQVSSGIDTQYGANGGYIY